MKFKVTHTRSGCTVISYGAKWGVLVKDERLNSGLVAVASYDVVKKVYCVGMKAFGYEALRKDFTNLKEATLYAQYIIVTERIRSLFELEHSHIASFEEWKDARKRRYGRG